MGSSVTKAKCALERFFIYCPAPPFMNVAIPKKCSEEIYFLAEMVSMGSIVTKAKCALERFFIYCPVPPFMNVVITKKCSKKVYIFLLKWNHWAAVRRNIFIYFLAEMVSMGSIVRKAKCALERFFIYFPVPPL